MKNLFIIPFSFIILNSCTQGKTTSETKQNVNVIEQTATSEEIEFLDAFSPNDDGKNETFIPKLKKGTFIEFKVYSRWGNLIFETQSPTQSWDGKEQNKACPIGVYYWTLLFINQDNQQQRTSGHVSLMR